MNKLLASLTLVFFLSNQICYPLSIEYVPSNTPFQTFHDSTFAPASQNNNVTIEYEFDDQNTYEPNTEDSIIGITVIEDENDNPNRPTVEYDDQGQISGILDSDGNVIITIRYLEDNIIEIEIDQGTYLFALYDGADFQIVFHDGEETISLIDNSRSFSPILLSYYNEPIITGECIPIEVVIIGEQSENPYRPAIEYNEHGQIIRIVSSEGNEIASFNYCSDGSVTVETEQDSYTFGGTQNLIIEFNDSEGTVTLTHDGSLNCNPSLLGNYLQPIETGLDVPLLQQTGGRCGPTSLAMVLNYYGENIDPNDDFVYSSIPWGTAYLDLMHEAESRGYETSFVCNATLDELIQCIDNGIPVIVSGRFEGRNNGHFVVVTGYVTDPYTGEITNIIVNDPWEIERTLTIEGFLAFWEERDNKFLAIAPEGSEEASNLPEDRYEDQAPEMLFDHGVYTVTHAHLDAFYPFDFYIDRDDENGEYYEDVGGFIGYEEWGINIIEAPIDIQRGLVLTTTGGTAYLLNSLGNSVGGDVGESLSDLGSSVAEVGIEIDNTITKVRRKIRSWLGF